MTLEELTAVQAAINTPTDPKSASPSDAIITLLQQMAGQGRFAEMCEAGKIYFAQRGAAKRFIASKVPAIVVNRYPAFQEVGGSEHLNRWLEAHPENATKLSEAFLSGRLPSVVEWTLQELRAAAA